MAFRIAGILLPQNKQIVYALPAVYGIGRTVAQSIVVRANVDGTKKTKDLTEEEQNRIRDLIEKTYKVEGDMRREVLGNIKHLKEISSYRGSRHTKRLPARGQRSKTNSRTVRGNVRRTMMSGKRKLTKT
ncbi:MAG: 30S ribosomal protein S13 [Patescibacteria group bacterium]